ncbi:GNAT family N-acetyltransferase [Brucella tritici]|uniref:Aminoglycoside N(6')-acetyltransferase type 1 n=2 Tax=Brucella tritici TaxID=94626 RepID=A0A7V7VRP3_9HYPH|nr:aminoglycoside 6'-N-acetyltransferase [Brucella tritici]KAB2655440.1 GNAT family N-acetyltransferase [Brucella tritici]
MHSITAQRKHTEAWAQLRHALWPNTSLEQHLQDICDTLDQDNPDAVTFIAESAIGQIAGFAEAALRRDYVNGCSTSPVLFLEGIFVSPEYRQHGVARLLCEAIANWGREKGCTEFASDVSFENLDSQNFHAALGFDETERVIFYRKSL